MYIPVFTSEPCLIGFQAVLCDANMLVPDFQNPPADPCIDSGDNENPCPEPEDEEFFELRHDDHGRGNWLVYGWHGGPGMQWLQGPALISLVPACSFSQANSRNNSHIDVGRLFPPSHGQGTAEAIYTIRTSVHHHASLLISSIKQVNCVRGMAGIEPMPSKSNDWTPLSPCQLSQGGCRTSVQACPGIQVQTCLIAVHTKHVQLHTKYIPSTYNECSLSVLVHTKYIVLHSNHSL